MSPALRPQRGDRSCGRISVALPERTISPAASTSMPKSQAWLCPETHRRFGHHDITRPVREVRLDIPLQRLIYAAHPR